MYVPGVEIVNFPFFRFLSLSRKRLDIANVMYRIKQLADLEIKNLSKHNIDELRNLVLEKWSLAEIRNEVNRMYAIVNNDTQQSNSIARVRFERLPKSHACIIIHVR